MRYYAVFVVGLVATLCAARVSWDIMLLVARTAIALGGATAIAVRGQSIDRVMAIGIGLVLIGFALFFELVMWCFGAGLGGG